MKKLFNNINLATYLNSEIVYVREEEINSTKLPLSIKKMITNSRGTTIFQIKVNIKEKDELVEFTKFILDIPKTCLHRQKQPPEVFYRKRCS